VDVLRVAGLLQHLVRPTHFSLGALALERLDEEGVGVRQGHNEEGDLRSRFREVPPPLVWRMEESRIVGYQSGSLSD
jgi:hypothetical protein